MSHVVFVNRYFHPDHSATSQLLSDLAFHLAEHGTRVTVLTSRQLYDDPDARLPRRETVRGVEISRLLSTRFGRQRLVGRAIDYATFHASVALALLRRAGRDTIVVALTDPPLTGVTARIFTALRKGRLVNWVQDLFPEVAEELGVLEGDGWFARALRRLRDGSLRAAALNVALGDDMCRAIEERGGRATVIHNWSAKSAVVPVPREENALRTSWGLGTDFVVGYSGNLGRAHEFDTIVDAMSQLAGQPIRFVVVGGGPRLAELRTNVTKAGLDDRVSFRPYQPREQLGEALSVADVHLISLRPGLEPYIVPSKFYGILAAGRPSIFVSGEDGDIPRLIREAECGLVVRVGDSGALAAAIRRLREDEELRDSMGRNARALFEARFTDEIAFALWERQLAELDESV